MELRHLGRAGPDLPVVGFGTWTVLDVQGALAEERAHAVVREALDAGVRVFDSSPMYGEAERVLADAVRPFRDQVFIATKVWARAPGEADRQIRRSLDFYGGRIDLYQVHNLSRIDEVLPRLKRLQKEGSVGLVGLTHYAPSAFPDVGCWAAAEGVAAVQLPLNARAREAETDLLPRVVARDLGVLVMEPLASGALVREAPPTGLLERLRPYGVRTWAQALIKWVLSDARVDVVLPATGVPGRPGENAEAGRPPWFPAALREEISRLVTVPRAGPSTV